MTPFLFHGPLARDQAVQRSLLIGLPIGDPVGDTGLKVDDSRRIVQLSMDSGVGDRPPSLVIGPLDSASPEASDALLKTLEDMADGPLRLILWTDYLSGVRGTIRSRTRAVWCPVPEDDRTYLDPLSYVEDDAKKLLAGVLAGDHVKVTGLLTKAGKEWPPLVQALVLQLPGVLEDGDPEACQLVLELWPRIRKALDGKGSVLVAADALLPEEMT